MLTTSQHIMADKLAAKGGLRGITQGCMFLTLGEDTCVVNERPSKLHVGCRWYDENIFTIPGHD